MTTVRPIQKKDLFQGFKETIEGLRSVGDLSDSEMETILWQIQQNPHHSIFVAVETGAEKNDVIGSITLLVEQKFIRRGGKVAHIEDVAVRPDAQGHGIGRQLVEYAVAEARRQGCYKAILDCSEDNIGFYEKLGFKKHEFEMRLDL